MTYKVSSRRAQRVVRFIEEFLVVPEGKDVGKPVRLRDWQLEFIDKVYGTPTRLAILGMGRKNGKSAITAMLLLARSVGPTAWPASAACRVPQARVATVGTDVGPDAYQALAVDLVEQARGTPGRSRRPRWWPDHPAVRRPGRPILVSEPYPGSATGSGRGEELEGSATMQQEGLATA